MRLSPEKFNWRLENRITGAYEIKAPRTFRRGQPAPHCENCGRQTGYLFDGFVELSVPHEKRATVFAVTTRNAPAKVCQRCRPLSDLEQKEKIRDILREFNQ